MDWGTALVLGLGLAAAHRIGQYLSQCHCMAANPVLQVLWDCARHGNAEAVRSMITTYKIPVDTPHHVYGHHLVTDIAAITTKSAALDGRLRDVLRVLADAGWSLEVVDGKRQNAAHLLAAQCNTVRRVSERLGFIMQAALQQPPRLDNLLAAVDGSFRKPEQRFHTWRSTQHMLPLQKELRDARLAIERACCGAAASARRVAQGGRPKSVHVVSPACDQRSSVKGEQGH
eukprot:jgi/Ulvmu1/7389/UM036_0049.1